ncbi:hypothetical protein [Tenacibaculum piscium]|uniref:hypothetical protein n=1 Tax=Tenacibaculum piscium TaxID=1458515 RepID=UPI001F281012|nr:hypothetical protein [Tenacibaculum piscium]
MQVTIKGYITSKESELFSDCADRYAYNEHHHKFSISDGVSKSFFPKFWAEELVKEFVSKEKIADENLFLSQCQEKWLKKITEIVNKPTVKWFTQNAFNKKSPALATFVGLQFFEKEKKWEASALGDSFLFFVPKKMKTFEDCIILSSKKEPIIFDNFPDYFSSIGEKFKGKRKSKSGKLQDGTFYLMTDALAEWFINEKENAIGKIDVWQNQKDFERFVDEERQTEKLGNDDSAILIINVEKVSKSKIKYSKDSSISDIYKLSEEQDFEISKRESEIAKKKEAEKKELQRKEEEEKSKVVENEITEEPELVVEKESANVENKETVEETESTSENDDSEVQKEKTKDNTVQQTEKESKSIVKTVIESGKKFLGIDNKNKETIEETKEIEPKQENTEPNKVEKKENISGTSKTEIESTKEIKKEPIPKVKESKQSKNITDKF